MTVFDSTFLFLRNPAGGVEDLAAMKAAGFAGVFCNVGDFEPPAWDTVRTRAAGLGMFCGPWQRTGQGPGTFSVAALDHLISVADIWASPGIVNSEAELAGTGSTLTTLIAQKVGARDFGISMEPWLFPNVDWGPVAHLPMLLQINPAENQASKDPAGCKWHAHELGCECVYFTFGTAPPQEPSWYVLQAPYSLYTGDNAGPNFAAWSPTSAGFGACQTEPSVPLTEKQFPYTGPCFGPSSPRGPTRGNTEKGLKRGMIRLGYFDGDLAKIDDVYNAKLERAFQEWQRDVEIAPATGQYGRGSWLALRSAKVQSGPHKGEYGMDAAALQLVRQDQVLMCYPHFAAANSVVCQGLHATAGLYGNWAMDFCCPGGTQVLAVENATIRKLSGRNPILGADQVIGIFGWSIHYETASGYRYFSTHYGGRSVQVGQVVKAGQVIGTVGEWPGNPGRSHTHLGVTSPLGIADAKKRITAVSNAPRL